MGSRFRRRAVLAAALLSALLAASGSRAQGKETLGLCPGEPRSLDPYIQSLCDAEAAVRSGKAKEALALFTAAAATPRAEATHELAWAGLAVAHCQTGDLAGGRQWAEHFAQARRLWLGELDCALHGNDPGGRIDPFVRSRMCSETLAADYALVRREPDAAHTIDLKLRLARLESTVRRHCETAPAARPSALVERTKPSAAKSKAVRKKKKQRARKPPT